MEEVTGGGEEQGPIGSGGCCPSEVQQERVAVEKLGAQTYTGLAVRLNTRGHTTECGERELEEVSHDLSEVIVDQGTFGAVLDRPALAG